MQLLLQDDVKEEAKVEEQKKAQVFIEETIKEKPFCFLFSLQLLYPGIWTEDLRKNYVVDLSSQIDMRFRLSSEKSQDQWQVWSGLRYASFVGSGTQGEESGSFSLSYFGPSISVGSFDLAPKSIGSQQGSFVEDPLASRSGVLWSLGVAAVSKYGSSEYRSGEISRAREFLLMRLAYGWT